MKISATFSVHNKPCYANGIGKNNRHCGTSLDLRQIDERGPERYEGIKKPQREDARCSSDRERVDRL
jgi:hypothetical protein